MTEFLKKGIHCVIRLYFRRMHTSKIVTLPKLDNISSILLGISSGLGDALMAEGLIQVLANKYPQLKIGVLTSSNTRKVFENSKNIERIWILENKQRIWNLINLSLSIRKRKYDVFIGAIPFNTIYFVLLPLFGNIPYRIKHKTPHKGFRDYDFVYHHLEVITDGKHRIECNLDLLKFVGLRLDEKEEVAPVITIYDQERQKAYNLLQERHFEKKKLTVGFHPGCNPKAYYKKWAPENFARLGDTLHTRFGAQIILVGGPDDTKEIATVESLMKLTPINVSGQCSIYETAAVIEHCDFFVSNDSGIMHLATAVDVPVFAIFGPTNERHIGPYGAKHTVIRRGEAVNDVRVEDVIDTLLQSEYGLKNVIPK